MNGQQDIVSTPVPELYPSTSPAKVGDQLCYRIFSGINEVPELLWNQIIPDSNVLMHSGYLRSLEESEKGKLDFRYVLIMDNEVPVGAVYFQMARFKGNDLAHFFPAQEGSGFKKAFSSVLKWLLVPLVNLIDIRLLVSGNIFMTGESGFYFSPVVDKISRARLLREAAAEVSKTDSKIKAVLISDLPQPHSEFDCDFGACSYHEVRAEADMSLRLRPEWKTFDDYLSSLSSKYRGRAKKTYKANEKQGIISRELSLQEIEENEGRLHELYEAVMENSTFKIATLSKNFFALQKKQFAQDYHIHAYYHNEELISFISCYTFRKKMEVHYCGMPDEASRPSHLYQRMMYDMLRLGIKLGMNQLHFGRTAPEIKSTIGASPIPTYGYVKHLNPLFNLFITRLLTRLLQPKEYVYRNPFKQVQESY